MKSALSFFCWAMFYGLTAVVLAYFFTDALEATKQTSSVGIELPETPQAAAPQAAPKLQTSDISPSLCQYGKVAANGECAGALQTPRKVKPVKIDPAKRY